MPTHPRGNRGTGTGRQIKVSHRYSLHHGHPSHPIPSHPPRTPKLPVGKTDAYAPHFIRRFRQVWQYPLVGGRPIWPRGLADLPGQDPKLEIGGRGPLSCQREGAENENESHAAPTRSPWPAAGRSGGQTSLELVAFSGLTRRLARQEARNAECGPSSSAAARLWMPDVEKLGRARPGSTVEDSRRLRLGSWGMNVGCGSGGGVGVVGGRCWLM